MDELQLDAVEDKLAAILLDAAVKIISLTNASMFVMMETETKRCFGGERRLCEMYRKGEMGPTDNDIQVKIEIDESPEPPTVPAPAAPTNIAKHLAARTRWVAKQYKPRKRRLQGHDSKVVVQRYRTNDVVVPRKRRRKFLPSSTESALKRDDVIASTSTLHFNDDDDDEDGHDGGGMDGGLMENGNEGLGEERDTAATVVDDEDDDDDDDCQPLRIERINKLDRVDAREALKIKEEILDPLVDLPENGTIDLPANGRILGADALDLNSEPQEEIKAQLYDLIADQIRNDYKIQEKVRIVQNMTDAEALKDNKSIEWKMLRSFFSIFGFQFAMSSDDWKNKYEQDIVFQTLWDFFPNLHPHLHMKIQRPSGHSPTLLAYCREAFFCRARSREYRERKGYH